MNFAKQKFIFILVFLFGCFVSFKIVFGIFSVDADSSQSIMLWYGVNSFGFSWLKDWIFTQDNWLFSLVPIHFLEFWLFGIKPIVVIATGWGIFVASALVSGLIAWQLKAKRAAFLIPILLIFVGNYAHFNGFVSYSTSHNITNLFGLISLSFFIKWLENRNSIFLYFILFFLLAGGLSDPWLIVAYNLPLLLVSGVFYYLPSKRAERHDFIKLFFISLFTIIAVQTQFFGVLDFLPRMHFGVGDWYNSGRNLVFLIKDMGGLLNIIPFVTSNSFISGLVSIIIFVALIARINYLIYYKKIFSVNFIYLIFSLLVFFSMGGVMLAFVLTGVPAAAYSGRFLLNILYLTIIVLCASTDLFFDKFSTVLKSIFVLIVILFFLSGVLSNIHQVNFFETSKKNNDVANLIDFLKKNNLTYGYGPYWGSQANAVTVVSKQEIIIRPVMFDKLDGTMIIKARSGTSKRWIKSDDQPHNTKENFVILANDGEECQSIDLCAKGISEQFGKPSKILPYPDGTLILVWDHPILIR